jgi:hypothetical protein
MCRTGLKTCFFLQSEHRPRRHGLVDRSTGRIGLDADHDVFGAPWNHFKPLTLPCVPCRPVWWPMGGNDLIFEQLTALIARLEIHIEQLTIHVDELKNHSHKDEVASEKARIGAMRNELDRLKKLKELYANRATDRVFSHH